MTKYTVVGDIHGKVYCVEEALSREGNIIFVGDFIDSFDRSAKDHDKCFELVIEAIRKGKARSIYGNHELSYIKLPGEKYPHHRCSGYDYHRSVVMAKYQEDIKELFEPFILLDSYVLISHAGLTNQLWKDQKLSLDNLDKMLYEWWLDVKSPMHWMGRTRGGRHPYGGLFWCDFDHEFEEIPELIQIFGHTRGDGIRHKGNSFCIDCLDKEMKFLELEI